MHITKINGASRFQSDIGCVQPELFAFLYATTYRDAAVDAVRHLLSLIQRFSFKSKMTRCHSDMYIPVICVSPYTYP